MSANIYWRPNSKSGTQLPVSAPSSFIEIMRKLYGEPPWTLGGAEMLELRGAAASTGAGVTEGFQDLIEAIEKHRSICVEVEY